MFSGISGISSFNSSGQDTEKPRQVKQGQKSLNVQNLSHFHTSHCSFFSSLSCCRQQNSLKKKSLPPVKFLEGEVIWAKFNRRPWWPCEVIVDPIQGIYHRVKGGPETSLTYCGLMCHIWVAFNCVISSVDYFGRQLIDIPSWSCIMNGD